MDLYKKYKVSKKKARPGALMQKGYKQFSEPDMGSMKGYDPNLGVGKAGMRQMQQPKPTQWSPAAMPKFAKSHKKHKDRKQMDAKLDRLFHVKEGSKTDQKMDRIEGIKDKKHAKTMCKSCGKSHAAGKHHKALKLVPPSKGHKPKGAHGRAAVHALGRTKTTGNFARIERARGKGAAVAAYQNALRAHKGK